MNANKKTPAHLPIENDAFGNVSGHDIRLWHGRNTRNVKAGQEDAQREEPGFRAFEM
jgi:hypothetical protein